MNISIIFSIILGIILVLFFLMKSSKSSSNENWRGWGYWRGFRPRWWHYRYRDLPNLCMAKCMTDTCKEACDSSNLSTCDNCISDCMNRC
jgi:hypothetical protein